MGEPVAAVARQHQELMIVKGEHFALGSD